MASKKQMIISKVTSIRFAAYFRKFIFLHSFLFLGLKWFPLLWRNVESSVWTFWYILASQKSVTLWALGVWQQTKHHQKLSLQHPASSSSEVVIVFEQKFPLTLWRQNSNTDQYISPSAKIKKCKKSTWKFYYHTPFLDILRQNGTPCIAQKPSLSSSLVEVLLVPPLAESLGQDLSPVCSE